MSLLPKDGPVLYCSLLLFGVWKSPIFGASRGGWSTEYDSRASLNCPAASAFDVAGIDDERFASPFVIHAGNVFPRPRPAIFFRACFQCCKDVQLINNLITVPKYPQVSVKSSLPLSLLREKHGGTDMSEEAFRVKHFLL